MAAAGLSGPRRAAGHQRSTGEDALQPDRSRQAARHHFPGDALPDGTAGDQIASATSFFAPAIDNSGHATNILSSSRVKDMSSAKSWYIRSHSSSRFINAAATTAAV